MLIFFCFHVDFNLVLDKFSSIVLITLAFSASVGITFLVLACAIPAYNNWWPMFVLIFYLLSPVPTMMGKRFAESLDTASNACVELCMFLTTGIVISACALPIVLAHRGVIFWGACGLVLSGNVVVFVTILTYFIFFGNEDFDYSMW